MMLEVRRRGSSLGYGSLRLGTARDEGGRVSGGWGGGWAGGVSEEAD